MREEGYKERRKEGREETTSNQEQPRLPIALESVFKGSHILVLRVGLFWK